MKRRFHIIDDDVRLRAMEYLASAPAGVWVTVTDKLDRNLEQNAKFHAICGDFALSPFTWAGRRLNARQWKHVLVISHAMATLDDVECITGLEGEPQLVHERESTAQMNVARMSSLIEYCICFATQNGIELSE